MNKRNKAIRDRVRRYMKAPMRILIKARDMYIKSMSEWSDRIAFGSFMGCPTGHVSTLPRSFSTNSMRFSNSDNDLRELIRAASTRSLGTRYSIGLEHEKKQQEMGKPPFPRSLSVGIGRIDEDKPCEFGQDLMLRRDQHVFKRSRSYACAVRRNSVVVS